MLILAAIVLAGLVTSSQQMVLPSGYRDGNCSASAFLNCDPYATCTDSTDGRQYICQCRDNATGDGFKTTVGGTGCKLSYKPCATSKDCPQYGSCSADYKCQCNKGFTGDGFNCTDINECPSPLCDPHAFCQNFPGGFKCVCDINQHYVGDGFNCTYGDMRLWYTSVACLLPRSKSGSNNGYDVLQRAVCNDVNACVCIKGYSGDGRNCTGCTIFVITGCTIFVTVDCTIFVIAVTCNKINNVIVTILSATGPFPLVIPDSAGTVNITYGALSPKISNLSWRATVSVTRRYLRVWWGRHVHCAHHRAAAMVMASIAADSGRIVDKTRLPQRIPKDCFDAKFTTAKRKTTPCTSSLTPPRPLASVLGVLFD
ncbi:hypothetical protein Btru_041688 [Bulinus truncatus]|nr:hypothetical protein Btru_041688 [Bulinus truncatus]